MTSSNELDNQQTAVNLNKIKNYFITKKIKYTNIHLVYTKEGFIEDVKYISSHLGDHQITCIEKMFPIHSHIVKNKIPCDTSFFDNTCFSPHSKHNKRLVCNIIEEAINQIIEINSDIIIFIVNQDFIDSEWLYNPRISEALKSRKKNTFTYSPIAIDLQSQKITNL